MPKILRGKETKGLTFRDREHRYRDIEKLGNDKGYKTKEEVCVRD